MSLSLRLIIWEHQMALVAYSLEEEADKRLVPVVENMLAVAALQNLQKPGRDVHLHTYTGCMHCHSGVVLHRMILGLH
jgi:hypothetical protein